MLQQLENQTKTEFDLDDILDVLSEDEQKSVNQTTGLIWFLAIHLRNSPTQFTAPAHCIYV